jgi:hypothetical protein
MPLELLVDVEDTTGTDVALGALDVLQERLDGDETLHGRFARLVQALLPLVLTRARAVRHRWQHCFRLVVAGRTEEVHELRPTLVRLTERRLEHLKWAQRLAAHAGTLTGKEVPGARDLSLAIADLERFQAEVLARWHSLEDLEDVVADLYPLNNARLAELSKDCQPPQSWYEQTDKPF